MEQSPERDPSHVPMADVSMTVATTARRGQRVVEVEQGQSVEPHDGVEGIEGAAILLRRGQLVPGGDKMTRIETDADRCGRVAQQLKDGGEVLEAISQGGALASGVLEQHPHARAGPRAQDLAEGVGEAPQAVAFRARSGRTRVQHHRVETERRGAGQFFL